MTVGVTVLIIREQALEISRESRPAKIGGVATACLTRPAADAGLVKLGVLVGVTAAEEHVGDTGVVESESDPVS